MLYTDEPLELEKGSYQKYHGTIILKPKAFKQYSAKLKKEQRIYTVVIRNTKLTSVDPEDVEKRLQDNKEDILQVDCEEYYELKKAKFWPAAGYFHVGDNYFVRVQRRLFLYVLLFLLLGALFIGGLLYFKPKIVEDNPFSPDLDPNAGDYTGQILQDPSEQESIVIPGFFKFTATSGGSYVQLYNPVENTVYFQYEIYNVTDSWVVAEYATEDEALAYISENQVEFQSSVVNGKYVTHNSDNEELIEVPVYSCHFENGVYQVLAEDYAVVFVTQMIEPGKQVMWNAYEDLGVGEYTLKFKVNTYDITTGAKCYGAIQTVEGIVR